MEREEEIKDTGVRNRKWNKWNKESINNTKELYEGICERKIKKMRLGQTAKAKR